MRNSIHSLRSTTNDDDDDDDHNNNAKYSAQHLNFAIIITF